MNEQGSKSSLTEISTLGEFGLIDHLTKDVSPINHSTIKGIGDDAAIVHAKDDFVVVTKDLLVEGVHFDLGFTPMKHLGYKSVAVNLSDVYAMNGRPEQIFVGIAVSSKYSVEALESLYEGIKTACRKYNVDLAGGDTTSSPAGMTLSITAIGKVNKDKVCYRSGAQVNDLICVSGNLGAAYCGLLVLQREKAAFTGGSQAQPDLSEYAYVIERQLKPEPRRDIIEKLHSMEIVPTSMIDISDGLASEILHLCKQSGNGAIVYEEHFPIDTRMAAVAHEFNLDPTTCALSGGEDYELLFTVAQKDFEKLKSIDDVSIIGHIVEAHKGKHIVSSSGQWIELTSLGWDGFAQSKSL